MNSEMSGHAAPGASRGPLRRVARAVLRIVVLYLLGPVVVVAAVMGAVSLYETGPKAQRRPPQVQATLVEVEVVSRTSAKAMVQAMGTVMASQEVVLQPRVSGEILQLSERFVPGGRFDKGEFILRIDPKDYELAVQEARSRVAQAEYESKLEEGQQEIAQREWELLGMGESASELDHELALRRPHLLRTQAVLEAAQASLRQAELDLERTAIHAPFNAIVTTKNVDLGAQVSPQSDLATLVGTDEYWVRTSVPVDQLHWIEVPAVSGQPGSRAMIRQELGSGVQSEWVGSVVRLMGDLEPQGRMARVLISVRDPLGAGASETGGLPLLIGSYVNVVIEGREIADVVELPRRALHDNETVWVMDDESRLDIRRVQAVWRNRDTVLVGSGLQAGERVVVSDLAAPVRGMLLTLGESSPAAPFEDGLADRSDGDPEHGQTE